MTTEKFDLSKKRSEWVNKWCQKKLTGRAMAELKQQDKEFIREITNPIKAELKIAELGNSKSSFVAKMLLNQILNNINKKAGKELIEGGK
jgi:hypothetical protein